MPEPQISPELDAMLTEAFREIDEQSQEYDAEDVACLMIANRMMYLGLSIIADPSIKLTLEDCRKFAEMTKAGYEHIFPEYGPDTEGEA